MIALFENATNFVKDLSIFYTKQLIYLERNGRSVFEVVIWTLLNQVEKIINFHEYIFANSYVGVRNKICIIDYLIIIILLNYAVYNYANAMNYCAIFNINS